MRIIYTAKGDELLVDDDEYNYLSQFSWYIDTESGVPRKKGGVFMHRLVLRFPKEKYIKFIDGNKFNCQKNNLKTTNTKYAR